MRKEYLSIAWEAIKTIYRDNGLWPTLITIVVLVIILTLLANLGLWTG